jgi:hypothetical protein
MIRTDDRFLTHEIGVGDLNCFSFSKVKLFLGALIVSYVRLHKLKG